MRYPILVLYLALYACSPALVVEKPPLIVSSRSDIECKRRAPTGTIRTQTVCTSAAEREAQRKAAAEAMAEGRRGEQAEAMRRQKENFPTSRGE
jgi:hypothetical protein